MNFNSHLEVPTWTAAARNMSRKVHKIYIKKDILNSNTKQNQQMN